VFLLDVQFMKTTSDWRRALLFHFSPHNTARLVASPHKEFESMSLMTNLNRGTGLVMAAAMLMMTCDSAMAQLGTDEGKLNAESFVRIHKQTGPQSGESRWMQIPWLTDLREARRKAAVEGKPLFLMVSGKGLSIGMC
jgi:hypothetical protein